MIEYINKLINQVETLISEINNLRFKLNKSTEYIKLLLEENERLNEELNTNFKSFKSSIYLEIK